MKMVVVKAIILDIQLTHHVVGGVPEAVTAVSVFLAAQSSNGLGHLRRSGRWWFESTRSLIMRGQFSLQTKNTVLTAIPSRPARCGGFKEFPQAEPVDRRPVKKAPAFRRHSSVGRAVHL